MKPKSKLRLPGSLRMAIILPLSVPALIWLAQPGQALEWNELGKTWIGAVQSKTIWDWMDLLLLPLLLAGGVLLWKRSQRDTEFQRAEQNATIEREIAADHQQEEALQAYFDRMADLLLKDKLSKFSADEVRNVARIRTLSVLRGLDARRKGLVLLFLKDAGLIADRLAIMHRGEIRVEGTLAGVLSGWGDRVSFLLPSDVRTADLPDVAGAGIEVETRDQELWATYTVTGGDAAERAHHTVAALMGWAAERDTVLQHLQVRGASLEDVFLRVADGAADLLAE